MKSSWIMGTFFLCDWRRKKKSKINTSFLKHFFRFHHSSASCIGIDGLFSCCFGLYASNIAIICNHSNGFITSCTWKWFDYFESRRLPTVWRWIDCNSKWSTNTNSCIRNIRTIWLVARVARFNFIILLLGLHTNACNSFYFYKNRWKYLFNQINS